jgi:hypothetical protein
VSIWEAKAFGAADSVDKAAGRPATASSTQSFYHLPQYAVDGRGETRWASQYADGQWWQVDLGSATSVDRVAIDWEAAYAPRYRISTSVDGQTWTTAAEATASKAGVQETTFAARSARYVRITGLSRVNGTWGISFFDAKVYGPGQ